MTALPGPGRRRGRGLRMDQRPARRRQRGRDLAVDGSAHPAVRPGHGGRAQRAGRRCWAWTSPARSAAGSSPSRPARTDWCWCSPRCSPPSAGTCLTWWLGMPSSSSHALIAGLVGAGLVAGARIDAAAVTGQVVVPTVALAGGRPRGGLADRRGPACSAAAQRQPPADAAPRCGSAQSVSAAAVALAHGLQDGQKTMGAIVLALVAAGRLGDEPGVPAWVRCSWWPRLGPRHGGGRMEPDPHPRPSGGPARRRGGFAAQTPRRSCSTSPAPRAPRSRAPTRSPRRSRAPVLRRNQGGAVGTAPAHPRSPGC